MKYILVDGDNGRIEVNSTPNYDKQYWHGWIYEVPDAFSIDLTLDKMDGLENIYELFETHPGMKLYKKVGG